MPEKSTLRFLRELRLHNNKNWFDAHRSAYEQARVDFIDFVGQLIPRIARFDPPIGELTPKECIFRINRDVRFSKNKDPYKSHLAAAFNYGGKRGERPGYYIHFEPGASFAAGGYYMPPPDDLQKIRQEIDYEFDRWKKIIGKPGFMRLFPEGVEGTAPLVRAPKGYDEENPAIAYLKMRGYIVSRPFSDAEMTDAAIVGKLADTFAAMKPFIDFLSGALD